MDEEEFRVRLVNQGLLIEKIGRQLQDERFHIGDLEKTIRALDMNKATLELLVMRINPR